MAYLVTDLRKVVKGYFFEVDNLGSMHVYKIEDMEYVDCIYLCVKPTRDKFESAIEEWLIK